MKYFMNKNMNTTFRLVRKLKCFMYNPSFCIQKYKKEKEILIFLLINSHSFSRLFH